MKFCLSFRDQHSIHPFTSTRPLEEFKTNFLLSIVIPNFYTISLGKPLVVCRQNYSGRHSGPQTYEPPCPIQKLLSLYRQRRMSHSQVPTFHAVEFFILFLSSIRSLSPNCFIATLNLLRHFPFLKNIWNQYHQTCRFFYAGCWTWLASITGFIRFTIIFSCWVFFCFPTTRAYY